MRDLIQAVLDDPVAALQDRSTAADQLVAAGKSAMPMISEVLHGNWKSAANPIDVMEAFSYLAKRIAKNHAKS